MQCQFRVLQAAKLQGALTDFLRMRDDARVGRTQVAVAASTERQNKIRPARQCATMQECCTPARLLGNERTQRRSERLEKEAAAGQAEQRHEQQHQQVKGGVLRRGPSSGNDDAGEQSGRVRCALAGAAAHLVLLVAT